MTSNDEVEENLFDEDFDMDIKTTPMTTINAKVVYAMKKLEDDANKIVEESAQENVSTIYWNFWLPLPW